MPEIGYNEALFAAACTYLTRGWSVIPVYNDLERAKVAAVRWSDYQHRKPSTMEAYRWFMERGYGGLAIVTGRVSGLAVLDFDTPERFDELECEYPHLTETYRVQTRRGVHLYYHVRQKIESRKAAGVDLQSDGCYVVAPPTLIGGHLYHSSSPIALKTLTEADIQQLYAFLTPAPVFADTTINSEADCAEILTAGDLVTLYGHLAARLGRNNALFQVSLRARDAGWPREQVVACLADAHVHQRADGAHHEESLKQRQREAIGTIESAYSRPPRQRRRTAGQMPNSVREALLRQGQTHTLRVIEGLQLRNVRPGQMFTYGEAVQRLRGIVGQWSIRRALTATAPDGMFLFSPSPRPPTQANADFEVPGTQSTQRLMISASKPTKIVRGRPTRCYFTMLSGYELCEKLGVRPSGSDTVAEADVRSARIYRQALHRAYIQRRPGQYPRSWLASRVGISIRTEQRYNLASDIQVKTRYDSVLISWSNLNAICADFEVAGTFLQDERGKRYPARQEIAAHLLAKRHLVIYKRQQANFYAYGDFSPQAVPSSGQRPRIPQARPPARTRVPLQAKLPMPEASAWQMAGRAAAPVSHDAVPQTAPPAMPMRNVQRAGPDIPVKPELKSKRFYRRPLADRRMEWLAQQIHLETSAGAAHGRMSLCNARRLLDTYGAKPVETALKRMVWLRQKGKISSPAGFLVIASRVAWRVQHGATEFGDGAPRFRGEPGRKAHKRQESQSSEI